MSTVKWLPTATINNNDSGVTIGGTPGNGFAFHTEIVKIGDYDYLVAMPHSDKMLPKIMRKLEGNFYGNL